MLDVLVEVDNKEQKVEEYYKVVVVAKLVV